MASKGIELNLKLLIDTTTQKVLFAEASKDVVDFLFSLLALPIGTVIKLVTKESMAGSLGETYGSLEKLDETYLLSSQTKSLLLNPSCSAASAISSNSLLCLSATDSPTVTTKKYYKCPVTRIGYNNSEFHNWITDAYGTICPSCQKGMTEVVQYLSGKVVKAEQTMEKGVVKGVVTYTVMDDLSVMPMSAISSITLLNKFGVKDLSTLEEKTVSLGLEEGLELLKASLRSKNVLSDVFLTKERKASKLETNQF